MTTVARTSNNRLIAAAAWCAALLGGGAGCESNPSPAGAVCGDTSVPCGLADSGDSAADSDAVASGEPDLLGGPSGDGDGARGGADGDCSDPVVVGCEPPDVPEHAAAVATDVVVCGPVTEETEVPECVWRCNAGHVAEADVCAPVAEGAVAAAWVATGGDKIVQEHRPALVGESVQSLAWDGEAGHIAGARNEVVEFAVMLETGDSKATSLRVEFEGFERPGGSRIAHEAMPEPGGSALFDTSDRPIEMFYVRYLQVLGLSRLTWSWDYDERHTPEGMRRPWQGEGEATGGWSDRVNADKHYPDIAVPLELEPDFEIAPLSSQMIWVDVYVPRDAEAGTWVGTITVWEGDVPTQALPVHLDVWDFDLPDDTSAGTMLVVSDEDIYSRYLGTKFPDQVGLTTDAVAVMDRHFQMAHRHRVSLIGGDYDGNHRVASQWIPRLDGSLFTESHGYDGPGRGVGLDVYAIGIYGAWQSSWDTGSAGSLRELADLYEGWFEANSPDTFRFVYLQDEPSSSGQFNEIDQWAEWIDGADAGADLPGMSTVGFPEAVSHMPHLDMPCMFATFAGHTPTITSAYTQLAASPIRTTCLYNGFRPGTGTFAIEDDGVALRVTAWAQHKLAIDWHMYWHGTYYDDYQSGSGPTDVFESARTFGGQEGFDPVIGQTGWNYTNGDGVLFYPGTDTVFPASSYGVPGPIASLRLKHWRRGIQDVEYLRLARLVDPAATEAIIESVIPKVLWEVGVAELSDPSWILTDVSWSNDPDVWESARRDLALIISGE